MSVEFINWYWIYSANIWGMYVIWRVSVRPSGAGLGNISGQECTFSYMYTCIGYKLPTFGEYMLVGGFLCALRAQGWVICLVRNVHFLLCIPDNFPPDKFPYGQLPPGQVPLASKHLKRTTSPRTTSPRTSSPGQVPLWTSSPQGELVRGAVVRGEVVC